MENEAEHIKKICKIELEVNKNGEIDTKTQYSTSGSIKFSGDENDQVAVLAHIMDLLHIEIDNAISLCLSAALYLGWINEDKRGSKINAECK